MLNSGFLYSSLTVTTEKQTLVVPGLLVEFVFAICFICLMKILNQKATIGIVVGLATILCYIKSRSTTRITIIVHSIPRHFSWFTNDS